MRKICLPAFIFRVLKSAIFTFHGNRQNNGQICEIMRNEENNAKKLDFLVKWDSNENDLDPQEIIIRVRRAQLLGSWSIRWGERSGPVRWSTPRVRQGQAGAASRSIHTRPGRHKSPASAAMQGTRSSSKHTVWQIAIWFFLNSV